MKIKRVAYILLALFLCYFIFNAIKIYRFSFNYSEDKCDVAIVLGAGTTDGNLSPIFRERLNHSIYLYNKDIIKNVILTGGYGRGQKLSDSEIAKQYCISKGIPNDVIIIEKKSNYTIENLAESKLILDSLGFKSVLLVTDPLHMKRSIDLAKHQNIKAKPSPTKTTMYKSFFPKIKSLLYETLFYTLGKLIGNN